MTMSAAVLPEPEPPKSLYSCRVLADSLAPNDHRLTTFEVTFPRIILAEFNTHRMLSRNSASSRAIPFEKQVKRVMETPFVPAAFGANKKGMQAGDNVAAADQELAEQLWLRARDRAVECAEHLAELGIHKQWVNRLLEPFMWHTVIVSATEWDNFFALRCHPAAQPEIQTIATMMRDALAQSIPRGMGPDEWHLPLVDFDDEVLVSDPSLLVKISAGRCARVSYLTHDGRRDHAEDIALCDRLIAAGHMSPMEHPAMAMAKSARNKFYGNFRGFMQYRKLLPSEDCFRG